MGDTWLIVGLGNPGPSYLGHRHNVGAMVLNLLAGRLDVRLGKHKTGNQLAESRLDAHKLILVKPNSFMNRSGGSVLAALKFFKIHPSRIVVIHDELDIPFESIRIKLGGGHGGHNGLRDIISALAGAEFIRVRVGIGRPPGRQDPANFVLSPFSTTERQRLPLLLEEAADVIEDLIRLGVIEAQQRWHAPH